MLFKSSLLVSFLAALVATEATVIGPRNTTTIEGELSTQALFNINIGQNANDYVAWISGESRCDYVTLGPVSLVLPLLSSPCILNG